MDWDFLSSPELKQLVNISEKLHKFKENKGYILTEDGENRQLDNLEQLLDDLIEKAKKGLSIQRYKGLGEMNPDQLWITTMDPKKRNLLKVRIEDMIEADDIFTVLMGDKVEPRREFIQNNALEVTDLDI